MQVTEEQKKKIDQVKTFLITLFKRFKLTVDDEFKNFIPDIEKFISVSYDFDKKPSPNLITIRPIMNQDHEFEVYGFASLMKLTSKGHIIHHLNKVAIQFAYILGMTLQESHVRCSNGSEAIFISDIEDNLVHPDYRVILDLENFGL